MFEAGHPSNQPLDRLKSWAPEPALAVLAIAVFLGCLGAVDLWGKREQRAAAETLDTIQNRHWLVAEIQGRPRLEKPPLPRWIAAGLMLVTGRSDEVIVRLPNALAALGTVALIYGLGRRLGGRAVGLTAGLAQCSLVFFISEMRQAGNDGLLTFFTTLALYLAWRRLHGDDPDENALKAPAERLGGRGDLIGFHGALGLGFLCKGPVVLLIVAVALVPYLAFSRRLRPGLKALSSLPGCALFLALALSWPVPVALFDPQALQVWLLEMGQKAGTSGVSHHVHRKVLALEWFWMTAPWSALATWAVIGPLARRGRDTPRALAFPWFWGVGNLAVFSLWKVAKPNYFLPCVPAIALLLGWEWVRLCRQARLPEGRSARLFLQLHWVTLFVLGALAPVVASRLDPTLLGWSLLVPAVGLSAPLASAAFWRRGRDAAALAPLAGALAVVVLMSYGVLAASQNATHSHRELAATLDRILPAEARTVCFFHELDEGLWFYLRDRRLAAVPGSTPRYNDGFDLLQDFKSRKPEAFLPELRRAAHLKTLRAWLDSPESERHSSYVLIRGKYYDLFANDLHDRVEVVHRERDLARNELVLLRVKGDSQAELAATRTAAPAH